VDTWTTFSYRWYSGYSCDTFLWTVAISTTWATLLEPWDMARSVRIYDAQWSGGVCLSSTWTWNNLEPNTPTLTKPSNGIRTTDRQFCAIASDPGTWMVTAYFVIWSTTYTWSTVASTATSCYTHTADFSGTWYAYVKDAQWANSPNSASWIARIDATASTVPTLTSPITWYINTTTPNLTRNGSTDAGVGVSGYNYQISTGNTFAVILNQWTGIATNRSPGTLTNGTKYFRRVRSFDQLYNTSAYSSTGEFTIDTTSPIVSTGYISVGTTGNNGATLYYRWAITVYATVSDTWLSGATCAYTTGITRATATFNTSNCTASIGSPTATLNIRFRIADQAGNVTTGATGSYLYDATASTVPTLTSPITWYINTTTPNLTRNGSTDAGVGVSGYNYQISTGNTFAVILNQWTGTATNRSPGTLTNGTKYFRRVRSFDKLYNTSAYSSTGEFTVDTTVPVVSTGYISVGTTGQNGNTGYYRWAITVYATVSDTRLSGATCAYTTGITRATATFNTTNCTASIGSPTATLNIRFRIADQAGNVTTGATGTYLYDATASTVPTLTSPITWYINTTTPNLTRNGSTDAGVGVSGYNYQISTGNTFAVILNQWTGTATNRSPGTLTNGTKYFRRVRSFDKLYNTSAYSSTGEFTVDTTSPIVSTGYISVGTTGQNGNTGYYRWAITVYAIVSDTWLSGATCAYTTGITRATATFNTTNCTASIGSPTATLNIRFRIADQAGNVTTGATGTYLYDGSWPSTSTTQMPTSGQSFYTWNIYLQRSSATDWGIGLSGYYYEVSTWSNFATFITSWNIFTTGLALIWLDTNTYYWRVRAFDQFLNNASRSNIPIFIVDVLAPSVVNVSSPNLNGKYNSWKIYIEIEFTKPISIDTWLWTPKIILNSK
jgi:hypothetical protein